MRTRAPLRLLAIVGTMLVTVSGLSVTAGAESTQSASAAIWLSPEEIRSLPTTGDAWSRVVAAADTDLAGGVLTNRDDHNTRTLAAALVGARLDSAAYRHKTVAALSGVVAAPFDTDDVLAAARRLGTYVIAADIVRLPLLDPAFDAVFKDWVRRVLAHRFSGGGGGGTIAEVQERRGNNFGTHAGASRTAAALYLGDGAELNRAAAVFRGWLGDRSSYAGFNWGDLSWQCDRDRPVGINAKGCTIEGHSVDGVLPDDQRRGGEFTWPPPKENYVWGGLQGAVVQAELLRRQGMDAWAWQDHALWRAVRWLYDVAEFPAAGDDTWQPWLVNFAYAADIPVQPARRGKNMAFTDWTHGGRTAGTSATPESTTTTTSATTSTTTTTTAPAPTLATTDDTTTGTSSSQVVLRAASSMGAASTTSLTLPAPAGVTAGDVLVATIDLRGKPKITVPAGWRLLRSDLTGRHLTKATYVRVAGPEEPVSYRWSFNKSVRAAAGVMVAVQGVDPAAPVAAVSGAPGDGSATLVAPAADTATGSGVLAVFGLDDDATIAPPAGMVMVDEHAVDAAVDVTSGVTFGVQAVTGSTGTKVATASRSGASVGHLVVLRPA